MAALANSLGLAAKAIALLWAALAIAIALARAALGYGLGLAACNNIFDYCWPKANGFGHRASNAVCLVPRHSLMLCSKPFAFGQAAADSQLKTVVPRSTLLESAYASKLISQRLVS
jgi:hypothetical protein